MGKKGSKTKGADIEVANEIGQPNQSTQLTSQMSDSIGISPDMLRGSKERELTLS